MMLELLGYWVGYLGCWIAWLLVAKLPLCLVAKLLRPAAPHARSRGGRHLRSICAICGPGFIRRRTQMKRRWEQRLCPVGHDLPSK